MEKDIIDKVLFELDNIMYGDGCKVLTAHTRAEDGALILGRRYQSPRPFLVRAALPLQKQHLGGGRVPSRAEALVQEGGPGGDGGAHLHQNPGKGPAGHVPIGGGSGHTGVNKKEALFPFDGEEGFIRIGGEDRTVLQGSKRFILLCIYHSVVLATLKQRVKKVNVVNFFNYYI